MMFNETEVMMLAFWIMDANEDGYLDADELDDMGSEDEHHEEGVAFVGLHVEREGEYGIAMPEGVTVPTEAAMTVTTTMLAMMTTLTMMTMETKAKMVMRTCHTTLTAG